MQGQEKPIGHHYDPHPLYVRLNRAMWRITEAHYKKHRPTTVQDIDEEIRNVQVTLTMAHG